MKIYATISGVTTKVLLPFEKQALSGEIQALLRTPYFKKLLTDKKELWKECRTRKEFSKKVAEKYNWVMNDSTVWVLVRKYQTDYINQNPDSDYVSPAAKTSHHGVNIDHEKLRKQRAKYRQNKKMRGY